MIYLYTINTRNLHFQLYIHIQVTAIALLIELFHVFNAYSSSLRLIVDKLCLIVYELKRQYNTPYFDSLLCIRHYISISRIPHFQPTVTTDPVTGSKYEISCPCIFRVSIECMHVYLVAPT